MNFKAAPEEKVETVVEEKPEKPQVEVESTKVPVQPTQVTQDDLFSAHDFDIKIDLDVPLPGKDKKRIKVILNHSVSNCFHSWDRF